MTLCLKFCLLFLKKTITCFLKTKLKIRKFIFLNSVLFLLCTACHCYDRMLTVIRFNNIKLVGSSLEKEDVMSALFLYSLKIFFFVCFTDLKIVFGI